MSGEISGAVLACGPVFSGSLRHTLVALGDHANPEGYSYPSIKQLAWSAGVSRRQVIRNIKELEHLRLLSVSRKRGKTLNYYTIDKDKLQAIAAHLRAVKHHVRRTTGGDWMEVCHALALQLRAALFDDPETFALSAFCSDNLSPHEEVNDGDTVSPQSPKLSPLKICPEQDVTSKVTPDGTSEVTSDGTQTFNNLHKPSRAPNPKGQCSLRGSRLGEEGREDGKATKPPPSAPRASGLKVTHKPTDYRKTKPIAAFAVTQRLATALGRPQHALCLALGSLTQVEDLAKQWDTGDLTLDQVRSRFGEGDQALGYAAGVGG